MNTRSEIQEAFFDYNRTGLGELKWLGYGPVQGEYCGRFVKLINGDIEIPG